MSILIKDFNGTDLIPFKEEYYMAEMIIGIVDLILLFLGILFGTLVIASILRVRNKSVDTLFVLSLCCADMIFNLYAFPSFLLIMINRGWSMSGPGCIASVSMIIALLAISILSITFITLNRYLAIIWKTNITRNQALVMIFLTWITFPIGIIIYYSNRDLTENSVALQPSNLYCLLDFTSKDPVVISITLIQIIFMSIPLVFMVVAYSEIIVFYRQMNRSREYVTSEVKNFIVWAPLTLYLLGVQIREKIINEGNCYFISFFRYLWI